VGSAPSCMGKGRRYGPRRIARPPSVVELAIHQHEAVAIVRRRTSWKCRRVGMSVSFRRASQVGINSRPDRTRERSRCQPASR
jgi:hypothetical protein